MSSFAWRVTLLAGSILPGLIGAAPDEAPCAENNNANLFDYHVPQADKPDF